LWLCKANYKGGTELDPMKREREKFFKKDPTESGIESTPWKSGPTLVRGCKAGKRKKTKVRVYRKMLERSR